MKYSVQAVGLTVTVYCHLFTKGWIGEPSARDDAPGEKNAGKRTRNN